MELLNNHRYKDSPHSKTAQNMAMTPEQAVRHIMRNPLNFAPNEKRGALISNNNVRKEMRKQNNKEAIIGKTRRL